MVDLILSLIFVVMSGAQMGEMVGTKVVVQNNLAGRLSESTTYMARDRRRIEIRSSVHRKNPDGSTETVDRTNIVIIRCDLGQSFTLNLETQEYTASVFPPVPLTAEQMESRGLSKPRMVKKLERLEMAWPKGFFTDIRYNFGTFGEREFR